jgi:alpha-glucosidase (family GH31 glycosyl hydrolase)
MFNLYVDLLTVSAPAV